MNDGGQDLSAGLRARFLRASSRNPAHFSRVRDLPREKICGRSFAPPEERLCSGRRHQKKLILSARFVAARSRGEKAYWRETACAEISVLPERAAYPCRARRRSPAGCARRA